MDNFIFGLIALVVVVIIVNAVVSPARDDGSAMEALDRTVEDAERDEEFRNART